MSESGLATVHMMSPNHSGPRKKPISKITIHHVAGVATPEILGQIFEKRSRGASSTYGIGKDGRIGQYVSEANRPWTSSSSWNDNQAVTIETSNSSTGGSWPISSATYESLVKLCVDICRRNGIKAVNYDGTKNAVLTEHRMFAGTACPGPTIHDLLVKQVLVNDINAQLLNNVIYIPETIPEVKVEDPLTKRFVYNSVDYNFVFDPDLYGTIYADLHKVFGKDATKLFNHFIHYGMKEHRVAHKNFNPEIYRKKYSDLDKAFDDDWPMYYWHYIVYGIREGRTAS